MMLSRGDARHLPFRAGIFDLVLFSPPYYERRQYGDDRRELGHEATPALYVDELLRVLDECERVLTRDGSVWVNIGDTYAGSGGAGGDYSADGTRRGDRKYSGTAALARKARKAGLGAQWPAARSLCLAPELLRLSAALGRNPVTGEPCKRWVVRSVVTWAKGAVQRAPLQGRPLEAAETVVMLAKPDGRPQYAEPIGVADRVEARGNVWSIPPARGREAHNRAPWPVELPRRIISATGARRVLDPFHGGGNTAAAAAELGVEYWGVELYSDTGRS